MDVSPSLSGRITLNGTAKDTYPSTRMVSDGKVVTLGAVPSVGYCFDRWEGDLTGSQNPAEVKVSQDIAVRAYFVPCSQEFASDDELVTMAVPEGASVLGADGKPVAEVRLAIYDTPPVPPGEASFVGPVYRLEPDGVTFDLPVGITWGYDSNVPTGIYEDSLVVACYEEAAHNWVTLSSAADSEADLVTASAPARDFSLLALLGYPPPEPATFSVEPLSIHPDILESGETTFIATQLANTGELEGTHTVTLKINGILERTKEMILDGGEEAGVVFSYSPTAPGEYQVDVDGVVASFTVAEPPPPPITTPEPPQVETPTSNPTSADPWYLSWPMAIIAAGLTIGIAIPATRRNRPIHR